MLKRYVNCLMGTEQMLETDAEFTPRLLPNDGLTPAGWERMVCVKVPSYFIYSRNICRESKQRVSGRCLNDLQPWLAAAY